MTNNRQPTYEELGAIEKLETQLACTPEDLHARLCLLIHYFAWQPNWLQSLTQKLIGPDRYVTKATVRLQFHTRWIIENAPGSDVANEFRVFCFDQRSPKFYSECKNLWLKMAERYPNNPGILENAAMFCSRSDVDLAENFLLQALEIQPENIELTEKLDYVQSMQTNDRERLLRNRIQFAQRIIAEAPTQKTVVSFTELLKGWETELEILLRKE